MISLLQHAVLNTDLDVGNRILKNVANFNPVPTNLCVSTDPRLSDARVPLPGSVTNASVAAGADISQSKLNLNGNIPATWLGTTSTTAAQGNLAEYLSNKGQPNGYASLDCAGKIPSAQVPAAVGTGTITSAGLTMPAQFTVSGSPVTTAGTLGVAWASVADLSWFGNKSGAPAAPQFYTTALPAALIPGLDTSKVTTGLFAAARLQVGAGLGGGHAAGAVPDPGDGTGGALASDYLARDMTWKALPGSALAYQPTVLNPTLTPSSNPTGPRNVVFNDPGGAAVTPGANTFYSTTSAVTGFSEIPDVGYISLAGGATVWSYSSKTGYNNSSVVSYTNPNP